jgi:hypothetical protein
LGENSSRASRASKARLHDASNCPAESVHKSSADVLQGAGFLIKAQGKEKPPVAPVTIVQGAIYRINKALRRPGAVRSSLLVRRSPARFG